MSINFNELRELLGAIATTDITELILKTEAFELTIRKGVTTPLALPVASFPSLEVTPVAASPEGTTPATIPAPESPTTTPIDKKWVAITAPMVGTFYRASAPGEAAFVEVGDRIRSGQTVCILEAMKLMNEIEAEVVGQVMEIIVTNGEPVEYGQTLMWINPD